MREITSKDNYIGMDFVGVRAHESLARSKYDYENFGKKQKGQYSFNPILEWTSAEIWLYIFVSVAVFTDCSYIILHLLAAICNIIRKENIAACNKRPLIL